MVHVKLYERIRQHIETNGVMLKFVAERSGIEKKKFYRLLSGKTEMSVEEYEQICKDGLGVDPSIFFKEKILKNEKSA